ncbi:LIC11966 family surface protein [Chitinophaga pinensis]|uniref:Lipoprotein n=1 Tax=Chitinophaga pinensis (strain ATCC 43595 / DSM 2588 / LMG 13176 / NBRC 15968 / NCIMB 11800 / UQM 2034) TaxID=485918 RepID=A0A979G8H9_CHIPD|nr:hypothetical protein [Chitinophaga pinensis]ACU62637.1 hypothetical protein Cpin_5206 [Chitinophaga pinensis DSM 2588]
MFVKMTTSLFALAAACTMAACNSSMDVASYNNELITVINDNEKQMAGMNEAMNSKDYTRAEQARSTWSATLDKQIKKVEDLGSYKGDDVLQKGVLNGLRTYKKVVTDDYRELITIRKAGIADEATAAKEEKALNHINSAFEQAAEEVNKASDAFEKKYAK